jgi:hypothetical protein
MSASRSRGGSGAKPQAGKADQQLEELVQRVSQLERHVAALDTLISTGRTLSEAPARPSWQQTRWPEPPPSRPSPQPPLQQPPPPPAATIQPLGSAVWRLDSGRAAAPRPPDGAEAGPSVADWITGPSVADWITGLSPAKLLALVGGGALLLAMALFLSLAFSRGWITPEMRVALGLLVGFGMLPAGALLFDRERPTLGHVVAGVGLGTIELALFASRLYELVPAEVALLAALTASSPFTGIASCWPVWALPQFSLHRRSWRPRRIC